MGEVNEGRARGTGTENGLHLAHVGVVRAEVGQQEDRKGGGHPMRHWCTFRKRSAGLKSTPKDGDFTASARM